MSVKEALESTAKNLKKWQKIENAAVRQTALILEQSDHPVIRMVAEIINHDSQLHYRVQQLLIDSIEKTAMNIDYRQLAKVWTAIEEHIVLEKKTIELANKSLEALKGTKNPVQQYFLEYLKADEEKHDLLLEKLNLIKLKMYP
jgi:hypothetical protein